MRDDYKQISKFYNLLSYAYSLGAVSRCRNFMLSEIKADMKVCFLGVGQGAEVLKALELGANVTVVDSSQAMLDLFQKNLGVLSKKVTVYHNDVMSFCSVNNESYDLVVCHFFLNVFRDHQMKKVLENALMLCNSGGMLAIGDFWQDRNASKMIQWLQKMNWAIALFIFRKLVNSPMHSIYIYDDLVSKLGFKVVKEQTFNLLGIPMYRSILVRK